MTPEQQAALEALAGRALTADDIAAIDPLLPTRRDDLIAARLSTGRVVVQQGATITTRGASAAFPAIGGLPGPLAFEAAMLALEAFASTQANSEQITTKLLARAVGRQLQGFQALGLDFGSPAMRSMLDTLAGTVLSPEQVAGFKGLAQKPSPLTTNEVSDALNRAENLLTLGD